MRSKFLATYACGVMQIAHGADKPAPRIPLCPGLTIVTAVNQQAGDYESIKTIESVGPKEVRLKYSAEMANTDWLASGPPLKQVNLRRIMLVGDLETATSYEQAFLEKSAETVPGTTSIGVSAAVLKALKTKGEAELGISNAYGDSLSLTADRNIRPNYYDYLQTAKLRRVGSEPVGVPVLVNDQLVELPAIHAEGDLIGEKVEFFFLDNDRNPLTLAFRLGVGSIKPLSPEWLQLCKTVSKAGAPAALPGGGRCDRPNGGDRDTLRVVKITCRCAEAPENPSGPAGTRGTPPLPGGGGTGSDVGSSLEQALAGSEKVDIYSIYFSFNGDNIRDESEPTLKEIAAILRRHPNWKLRVSGHTDGIGTDKSNMDLSQRRAAAVKDALVKRYGIDAARLTTAGFGKSQPKDTNETLEGRARNRRVELTRQS